MRKLSLFALAGMMAVAPAFAFDVSPTQTPVKVFKHGHVTPSPKVIDAALADEKIAKGIEVLALSDDGRSVNSLRGNLSDTLTGDLDKASRDFLRTHPSLLNIPTHRGADDMVKLISQEEAAGGTHLSYQMRLDGVRVLESNVDLHIGKDKTLQLVNGSFPQMKEVTNQISIGRIEALAASKRALGAKSLRATPKAELVIVPQNDGTGLMAYEVKMASTEPLGDYEILINAETGKEISRINNMVFAEPVPAEEKITGKGTVYQNHPLISALTSEVLPHLDGHALVGKYAKIVNEDTTGATNEKDEYVYDPNDTHFDEVQMYYFINKVHDFYAAMGFKKLDFPIKATVHKGDKYDNAYFSPMENAMAFGDGNKLNDLSKEETVCWHEYSHAAIAQIQSLKYAGESGAINEGQADYFACSLSNDPKLGEWAMKKLNKPWLRNVTDNLHYPEDIQGEVHADGRIWGVVLWDLRIALGAQVSDPLIYNSHYYLKSTTPKFIDGLNAIIAADANLYNGQYKTQILEVFKKRGIGAGNGTTVLENKDLKSIQTFRSVHTD